MNILCCTQIDLGFVISWFLRNWNMPQFFLFFIFERSFFRSLEFKKWKTCSPAQKFATMDTRIPWDSKYLFLCCRIEHFKPAEIFRSISQSPSAWIQGSVQTRTFPFGFELKQQCDPKISHSEMTALRFLTLRGIFDFYSQRTFYWAWKNSSFIFVQFFILFDERYNEFFSKNFSLQ